MAVGGHSSVVRALAAQASDLGSIPGGFLVLFHIPFSACVSINTLLILIRYKIELGQQKKNYSVILRTLSLCVHNKGQDFQVFKLDS